MQHVKGKITTDTTRVSIFMCLCILRVYYSYFPDSPVEGKQNIQIL